MIERDRVCLFGRERDLNASPPCDIDCVDGLGQISETQLHFLCHPRGRPRLICGQV